MVRALLLAQLRREQRYHQPQRGFWGEIRRPIELSSMYKATDKVRARYYVV
jgi:hypothetical protein